ncbi:inorganic anion transporter, SulP family [Leptospira broomii serovar Hurstbridge str. 5399]|uniref:Carbonic anhydrase 2 n=1 Tax=Leptospira broomii serovar Hurstbridge str. 5399 TaxID=1049789 RepID=T0EZ39_9LEPT|nr:SulP family inorganic anion transporter [Leptospira broomii]EQA44120.1 inorganic anion transporter, SulP family [Leptospira broomii serovar Hurstbridge str. 5399]
MRSKIDTFRKNILFDALAGLAVFIVAIPLCLGIAHASGAPLFAGIISGFIGGIIVGSLSRSSFSVSGPTASLTGIVLSGISDLGNFETFLLSLLIAGGIQIILGILRSGKLAAYFPSAVVTGMLVAIGIILIIKQFPHLMGYDIEEFGVEEFDLTKQDINETYQDSHEPIEKNTFTVLLHSFLNFRSNVFVIGFLSLVAYVIWEKKIAEKFRFLPASLIAIGTGVLLNVCLEGFNPEFALGRDHLVQLPILKNPSDLFGQLTYPNFSAWRNPSVWSLGLLIALVASVESLLCVEIIDRLDEEGRKTPMSRELLAQGVGNIACGLIGGIPLTSVIVRGSVNIASGAKSKVSVILHGVLIALSILLLPTLMNRIPLASLAAILVVIGIKLAKPKIFRTILSRRISQWLPFLGTVIITLFSDLLIGTFCGIILSLVFVLYEDHRTVVIRIEDHGKFRRIVLGENLGFFHKARIREILEQQPVGITLEIDGSRTLHIDQDVTELIHEFRNRAARKNISVILGGIPNMNNDIQDLKEEMDRSYRKLLNNNRDWAKERTDQDPMFFSKLAEGQTPQILFIGCSDSRVPIDVITKTDPGMIFTTRNIANIVSVDDISLFSVVQYAIEVLNIKHIIVCGHYECGGIKAALTGRSTGLIDNWITHIKDIYLKHRYELDALGEKERERKLIELNVAEQVINLYKTSLVQSALKKYGFPRIHGWVYDLGTGNLKEVEYRTLLRKELGGFYEIELDQL